MMCNVFSTSSPERQSNGQQCRHAQSPSSLGNNPRKGLGCQAQRRWLTFSLILVQSCATNCVECEPTVDRVLLLIYTVNNVFARVVGSWIEAGWNKLLSEFCSGLSGQGSRRQSDASQAEILWAWADHSPWDCWRVSHLQPLGHTTADNTNLSC